MSIDVEYVSYRNNAIFAESMSAFLNGGFWGAVWGCVTPFYPVGSLEYKREVATGVFRAAPPFHAMRSIPSSALCFASVCTTKSLCTRTMAGFRGEEDGWNDVFGFGGAMGHIMLLNTDRRLKLHNRAVASVVAMGLIYANFIA